MGNIAAEGDWYDGATRELQPYADRIAALGEQALDARLAVVQEAADRFPRSVVAQMGLVNALERLGEHAAAEATFRRLIADGMPGAAWMMAFRMPERVTPDDVAALPPAPDVRRAVRLAEHLVQRGHLGAARDVVVAALGRATVEPIADVISGAELALFLAKIAARAEPAAEPALADLIAAVDGWLDGTDRASGDTFRDAHRRRLALLRLVSGCAPLPDRVRAELGRAILQDDLPSPLLNERLTAVASADPAAALAALDRLATAPRLHRATWRALASSQPEPSVHAPQGVGRRPPALMLALLAAAAAVVLARQCAAM